MRIVFILLILSGLLACNQSRRNNKETLLANKDRSLQNRRSCSLSYLSSYDPTFHLQENINTEFKPDSIRINKYKEAKIFIDKKLIRKVLFDSIGRIIQDITYMEYIPGIKASITEYEYRRSTLPVLKTIYWSALAKDEIIRDIDKTTIHFKFEGKRLISWKERSHPQAVFFGGNYEYFFKYDPNERIHKVESVSYNTDGSIHQRWQTQVEYLDTARSFNSVTVLDGILIQKEKTYYNSGCDTLVRNVLAFRQHDSLPYKETILYRNGKISRIIADPGYYGEDSKPTYWDKEFIYTNHGLISELILRTKKGKIRERHRYVYR